MAAQREADSCRAFAICQRLDHSRNIGSGIGAGEKDGAYTIPGGGGAFSSCYALNQIHIASRTSKASDACAVKTWASNDSSVSVILVETDAYESQINSIYCQTNLA